MNSVFRFHCKQGQCLEVIDVLENLGLKPYFSIHPDSGYPYIFAKRNGISNRKINRALFAAGVPGAHSGKNRYRIIKGDDKYDVLYKAQYKYSMGKNEVFVASINNKLRKVKIVLRSNCECCGPIFEFNSSTNERSENEDCCSRGRGLRWSL